MKRHFKNLALGFIYHTGLSSSGRSFEEIHTFIIAPRPPVSFWYIIWEANRPGYVLKALCIASATEWMFAALLQWDKRGLVQFGCQQHEGASFTQDTMLRRYMDLTTAQKMDTRPLVSLNVPIGWRPPIFEPGLSTFWFFHGDEMKKLVKIASITDIIASSE